MCCKVGVPQRGVAVTALWFCEPVVRLAWRWPRVTICVSTNLSVDTHSEVTRACRQGHSVPGPGNPQLHWCPSPLVEEEQWGQTWSWYHQRSLRKIGSSFQHRVLFFLVLTPKPGFTPGKQAPTMCEALCEASPRHRPTCPSQPAQEITSRPSNRTAN